MFKPNEGLLDRLLRALLGVALLLIGLWPLRGLAAGAGGLALAAIGLVLLITAITGFCLIYRLLGFTTLKQD